MPRSRTGVALLIRGLTREDRERLARRAAEARMTMTVFARRLLLRGLAEHESGTAEDGAGRRMQVVAGPYGGLDLSQAIARHGLARVTAMKRQWDREQQAIVKQARADGRARTT